MDRRADQVFTLDWQCHVLLSFNGRRLWSAWLSNLLSIIPPYSSYLLSSQAWSASVPSWSVLHTYCLPNLHASAIACGQWSVTIRPLDQVDLTVSETMNIASVKWSTWSNNGQANRCCHRRCCGRSRCNGAYIDDSVTCCHLNVERPPNEMPGDGRAAGKHVT